MSCLNKTESERSGRPKMVCGIHLFPGGATVKKNVGTTSGEA